jgi:ribosomal protein S18 acetylase RimI-like enzyme
MTIRQISDKTVLHQYLIRDRIAAAYQLGDLDEQYVAYCKWWGHENERGILDAVTLLYTGLRTPVVLTLGDSAGTADTLDAIHDDLPERFFCQVHGHHVNALKNRFRTDDLTPRIRMGLHRSDYQARPVTIDHECTVLSHTDTADLMALYQFYPDNFFEPYQLGTGYYYGLRLDGLLVSIAGIHSISEEFDIAVVGNLVTHPEYRSQGLGRACTATLLNRLFDNVSLVALNVMDDNQAARQMCRNLGFGDHVQFYEGIAEKGQGS